MKTAQTKLSRNVGAKRCKEKLFFPYYPHNEREFSTLVKKLDELIDEVGSNEKHPLASAMETIGVLIEKYEEEHHPMPDVSGAAMIKYLMDEHSMKQSDLSTIGTQGVVSEILSGKRELNVRQIKKLSALFSVSPSVFL